ncbi:hypothetical protein N7474_008001 [Penicillium riverlandense]|uniref:uncharacterized protein n=1 Tax=Penicillium riverlandense TaxID=1903569 RepID=UPI0025491EF9|nr:uncharacterized protein N7474_008001 [Penicillium riverlandense]KAJ5811700.1 hypothetical protein N7474_008001 [Penicillium riverlandense]
MEPSYEEEHSNPFELERPDYLHSPAKAKPVQSLLVSPDFHRMSENAQRIYLMMVCYKGNPYLNSDGSPSLSSSGSSGNMTSSDSRSSGERSRSVECWHFPMDGVHEELLPQKLSIPIKKGHQRHPALENEVCNPVRSRVASLDFSHSFRKQASPSLVLETINEVGAADKVDKITGVLRVPETTHKKLFGEKGWLEDTGKPKGLRSMKSTSKRLKSLGNKIKQQIGELADDVSRNHPGSFNSISTPDKTIIRKTTVPISLDLGTQAKLYSELEYMICATANAFLLEQYYDSRISKESIKRIQSFWGSKNRPQVTEFHFDQTTQREFILYNIRTLRFYGECAVNPVLLHSNLRNWKAIATEMSVRTFCLPDSAIRKHLHDIQKLLEMLNAPVPTLQAFHQIQLFAHEEIIQRLKKAPPRNAVSFSL